MGPGVPWKWAILGDILGQVGRFWGGDTWTSLACDGMLAMDIGCSTLFVRGSTCDAFSRYQHCGNGWRRGVVVSGVRRMNEVNARRARLVRGWVTVFGRVYHLGIM